MTDNEHASSEPKRSESTTGIVLALIFFFPLGLYWMWKFPNWPTRNKWAVTGGIAVLLLIGAFTDDGQQAEPQTDDVTTTVSAKPAGKDKQSPANTTRIPRTPSQRATQPTYTPNSTSNTGDKYDREAARLKARSRSAGNGSLNDEGIQRLMDASRAYDEKHK